MSKRLYRSRSDRMIWGVCGGLANYFGIDPVIVRIIFILSIFVNGLGILAYIILAIVVPLEGSKASTPGETVRQNVEEMKAAAEDFGRDMKETMSAEARPAEKDPETLRLRRRQVLGIIIIIVGIVLLLNMLGFLWFPWHNMWPVVLIVIGLLIVATAWRRK